MFDERAVRTRPMRFNSHFTLYSISHSTSHVDADADPTKTRACTRSNDPRVPTRDHERRDSRARAHAFVSFRVKFKKRVRAASEEGGGAG